MNNISNDDFKKFNEFKISKETMESLVKATNEATDSFLKMWEATKNFCVMALNEFSPWLSKNIKMISIEACKNKRVRHLALYAKKERTRKKNISRAIRIVKKQTLSVT